MARHVTVNFIRPGPGGGARRFRFATSVVENATRLRRLGLARDQTLEVVLVGDVDALDPETLAVLDRAPCRLHRPQAIYEALAAEHRAVVEPLGGLYGIFNFAFLRWLLIDALFPGEPVLCYDGDVLHNAPLDALARTFDGLTTTATSTMFAAIADRSWFDAWRRGLVALGRDIDGFIERRAVPALPPWCRFRQSPEEFLAKILIEADELPQDPMPADFPYWLVPQPQLLPRLYGFVRVRGGPQRIPTPMRYRRVGGIDHINDRPVAFWHLQKPFLSQLTALAILRREAPDRRPPRVPPMSHYRKASTEDINRGIDPYFDEDGAPLVPPELAGMAARFLEMERRAFAGEGSIAETPFAPPFLCAHYFERNDLSLVFDDAVWPVPGVWAAPD